MTSLKGSERKRRRTSGTTCLLTTGTKENRGKNQENKPVISAEIRTQYFRIQSLKRHMYTRILDVPSVWSSHQSFWLETQRSRDQFPALPNFLISGSVTGSTQHREDK
jgi:hypothetical protein